MSFGLNGRSRSIIVADSLSRMPLSGAAVFDCSGAVAGITDKNGRMPFVAPEKFPVAVRYLGYREITVDDVNADSVFLQESISELPEIIVESKRHKVLHMLAYVREYSTLTTYTDTVFLFREKMVDYMLTPDPKVKFKGWTNPRMLTSRSYYRFTNVWGLDSVSDASNHHFSWSDWIGVAPVTELPQALKDGDAPTDTLRGRYSASEIWTRNGDRVNVDIDVLADKTGRKWVPNLSAFFRKDLDFEYFRIKFNYDNITGDSVSPLDMTGYSFNIESNGRGHEMFRFNRINEPFFVSTYAEVYMLDKEYITVKEAKQWDSRKFDLDEIGIYEPLEAPELQPSVLALVERVNNVDKGDVRLAQTPDHRLAGNNNSGRNFKVGRRALFLLKQLTGISAYKFHKNFNDNWKSLRKRNRPDSGGRKSE